MYCGHIGIGLGAKGIRPKLALLFLLLVAFGCDLIETVLIVVHAKHTPLWSHSIPAVAVGAAVFGIIAFYLRRSWSDVAFVVALYLTHPLVDYLTGFKPLFPRMHWIGLQLYHKPTIDLAMESVLIVIGWLIYRRSLPIKQQSHFLLWLLLAVLIALQAFYDIVINKQ